MTRRSAGIAIEERARRWTLACDLVAELTLDGKIPRAVIEERLGLPVGKLTEMCRRTTRKRLNKESGERVEAAPGGLEDWEFAFIVGKGYDKGRGPLTDRLVFEFGLGQLVEGVQLRRGTGLTEDAEAESEKEAKDTIKAQLSNRHKAHRLFVAGLSHVRRGDVPWSSNGRRKKWSNASPPERLASFEAWFNAIACLGCYVVSREGWNEWFEAADPAASMEQFFWHWSSAWSPGEAPCPPWIWPDLEYWDAHGELNSSEFLDDLILVTESDLPYSPYHRRFVQARPHGGRPRAIVGRDCDSSGDGIESWPPKLIARAAISKAKMQ